MPIPIPQMPAVLRLWHKLKRCFEEHSASPYEPSCSVLLIKGPIVLSEMTPSVEVQHRSCRQQWSHQYLSSEKCEHSSCNQTHVHQYDHLYFSIFDQAFS